MPRLPGYGDQAWPGDARALGQKRRAEALISAAHPEFRDELIAAADKEDLDKGNKK